MDWVVVKSPPELRRVAAGICFVGTTTFLDDMSEIEYFVDKSVEHRVLP